MTNLFYRFSKADDCRFFLGTNYGNLNEPNTQVNLTVDLDDFISTQNGIDKTININGVPKTIKTWDPITSASPTYQKTIIENLRAYNTTSTELPTHLKSTSNNLGLFKGTTDKIIPSPKWLDPYYVDYANREVLNVLGLYSSGTHQLSKGVYIAELQGKGGDGGPMGGISVYGGGGGAGGFVLLSFIVKKDNTSITFRRRSAGELWTGSRAGVDLVYNNMSIVSVEDGENGGVGDTKWGGGGGGLSYILGEVKTVKNGQSRNTQASADGIWSALGEGKIKIIDDSNLSIILEYGELGATGGSSGGWMLNSSGSGGKSRVISQFIPPTLKKSSTYLALGGGNGGAGGGGSTPPGGAGSAYGVGGSASSPNGAVGAGGAGGTAGGIGHGGLYRVLLTRVR